MKNIRNKSRLVSLFAAAVMIFNLLPASVVNAEETISISTVNDFRSFTEKCVYDEYSKSKKFVLQNDIDLKGTEITAAEVFCGVFEGGGHSIKNLKIDFSGSTKGLFCTLTSDAEIRNLNIEGEIKVSSSNDSDVKSIFRQRASSILQNVDVTIDELDTTTKAAGGLAGYNEGKIINCSFGGKITGQSQVGGLVGYNAMTGVIDSCANEGTINGDSEVGGLAGYNEGRIKLSKNKGIICPDTTENTNKVGGICGNNEGAVVICTNDSAVGADGFGDNIGGICGVQSGEIRESINNGEIRGRRSVGGVCGRFEPYTDIDLSYESAKAAIKNQADILKGDMSSAKSKLLDYGLELLTGSGDFSSLMSLLGLSSSLGSTSSRLDTLTDAAVNMMNSIADTFNQGSSNISSFTSDISSFTDETKGTIRETGDSLNKSLESLDDFLDEFDGKGQEISDTLDKLNDALDKGQSDVDDIKDKLSGRLDSFEEDIDKVTDNLDAAHSNLTSLSRQLKNASGDAAELFSDLDRIVVDASTDMKKLKSSVQKLADEIKKITGNVIETLKPIISSLPTRAPKPTPTATPQSEAYNVDPEGDIDGGYDVIPAIGRKIRDMIFTEAYAANDEKTSISELKSTEISIPRLIGGESADTALIKYCINNGTVNGSELAGGIAGSVGFESVVRSGATMTLPNGKQVDRNSLLKAVIESCISYGGITAKTEYAGGICGKSDIGNIRNSLTTGEIKTEDGGYAGGTAGSSGGEILNCIAINDISGNDHIGGIAGAGKDIKSSYALPRLDGKKDKSGAVAGFVTGEVSGCYFIDEGLSGIDGVTLEGKAQSLKPEEMTSSDGTFPERMNGLGENNYYMASDDLYMPQIMTLAKNDAENIGAILQSKSSEMSRFHFNVIFIDKGRELKSMTVDYGTVLRDSDIPALNADGTQVPLWDKDVHSPIIRHTTFTAEYDKATTTIDSGEEPPVLLLESVFDEGTSVSLKEEDIEHKFSGYKTGDAYSFTLTNPAYDVIKVHIRDSKKKANKIGVQIDGKWEMLDCGIDGSYAVFEINEPGKFVILYKRVSPLVPIGSAAAVIAVLIGGLILGRRLRRYAGKRAENV